MRCYTALFALTAAVSVSAFTIHPGVHGVVSQPAQVAPVVNFEALNRSGVVAEGIKALPKGKTAESTGEKKVRREKAFGKAHADFTRHARRQGNGSDDELSSKNDTTDCSDGLSTNGTSTAPDSGSDPNSSDYGNSASSSTYSGEDDSNGQEDECGEDEGASTTTSTEPSASTTGSSSYNSSNEGDQSTGGSSTLSSTPQATSSSLSNQGKHHIGGSSASSSSAAKATSSASSSSSGVKSGSGSVYSGMATFFYQDGAAGACGNYNQDSTPLVAINSAMYDGGKWCGKTVAITRTSTGKTINAIAQDECPGCGSQSLDLSLATYNQLGTEDEGTFPITWQFVI